MKRIACFLLLAAMLLAMAACAAPFADGGTDPEDSGSSTDGITTTTPEEEESSTEPKEEEIDPEVLKMRKDLQGLNVLVLGDSQMAGARDVENQWCNLLAKECGWNMTNLGISGMTVSFTDKNYTEEGKLHKASMYEYLFEKPQGSVYYWGSKNWVYYSHGTISGKAEDLDLILLQGGNNDFGPDIAAPLGAWGEKDPATFMGAWQLVVDRLMEDYPNAIIIFIPPFEYGETQRTHYTRNIKTMYEEYQKDEAYADRIGYIDAGVPEVSGVHITSHYWKLEHSYDDFHLKASGMRIMADHLLPYIWEIVMDSAQ